jgi:hypothetical protein
MIEQQGTLIKESSEMSKVHLVLDLLILLHYDHKLESSYKLESSDNGLIFGAVHIFITDSH